MSDKPFLKILKHRETNNERRSHNLAKSKEKLKEEIDKLLLVISQNDKVVSNLFEDMLKEIGFSRTSKKKLDFIQFLIKMYNAEQVKEATGIFLFVALDDHDPKKGTKKRLFMGIMRNMKDKKAVEKHINVEINENDIERRIKEYMKK